MSCQQYKWRYKTTLKNTLVKQYFKRWAIYIIFLIIKANWKSNVTVKEKNSVIINNLDLKYLLQ